MGRMFKRWGFYCVFFCLFTFAGTFFMWGDISIRIMSIPAFLPLALLNYQMWRVGPDGDALEAEVWSGSGSRRKMESAKRGVGRGRPSKGQLTANLFDDLADAPRQVQAHQVALGTTGVETAKHFRHRPSEGHLPSQVQSRWTTTSPFRATEISPGCQCQLSRRVTEPFSPVMTASSVA